MVKEQCTAEAKKQQTSAVKHSGTQFIQRINSPPTGSPLEQRRNQKHPHFLWYFLARTLYTACEGIYVAKDARDNEWWGWSREMLVATNKAEQDNIQNIADPWFVGSERTPDIYTSMDTGQKKIQGPQVRSLTQKHSFVTTTVGTQQNHQTTEYYLSLFKMTPKRTEHVFAVLRLLVTVIIAQEELKRVVTSEH